MTKEKANSYLCKRCKTPHVTEDDVKQRFLVAFNTLMGIREELLTNCRLAQQILCDQAAIEAELAELRREIDEVTELSKKAIYENAYVVVSQNEWSERNNSYLEQHRKATQQVAELERLQRERQNKFLMLEGFVRGIESCAMVLEEFDDKLWAVAVEKVKVLVDGKQMLSFKDGTEVDG